MMRLCLRGQLFKIWVVGEGLLVDLRPRAVRELVLPRGWLSGLAELETTFEKAAGVDGILGSRLRTV
jgi:hypothetical protein